jgi:virulence factor Mce-like protein
MRRQRQFAGGIFDNPVLIGTVTLLIVGVGVYLSYIAGNGLPFVPSYRIAVDIPNASEVAKAADVRIGGARVGQVLKLEAQKGTGGRPPYARLTLLLNKSLDPLPADTTDTVRVASVLGGKYIALTPGRSTRGLPDGAVLSLSHSRPFVDLDQAFRVFDPQTTQGIRNAINALGDALAGRGSSLNEATGSTARLIGPLENVTRIAIAPSTSLPRLIDGLAATTSALAPVAGSLGDLFDKGATTLAALQAAKPALAQSLDALPGLEAQGTQTLTHVGPVLADAAAIARDLRPAAPTIAPLIRQLDRSVHIATPVLRTTPQLAGPLNTTFHAIARYASDPTAIGSLRALGGSDFATVGVSAFVGLGAILHYTAQSQLNCNSAALWIRNLGSIGSEGNPGGSWIRMLLIGDIPQFNQSAKPSADLHDNFYPNENSAECESGNEPFAAGQSLGNPPGNQSRKVEITSPPAGVTARARRVGLLPSADLARSAR